MKIFEKPVTRRGMLKYMGAAAAVSALPMPGRAVDAARRPNIVFILSDDHRYDAMSCMGHPFIKTPNLDRLSREGIHFNNAFVTTSLCSPSRASFLTGQYARTHGVKNNYTPWSEANTTFLELLKKGGYDTAFIGKWHMPGRLPKLRGVDRFVTFTVNGGQGKYYNCPLIVDGVKTPSRKQYITEELADYAIEFMKEERDNSFCLYLSFKAVHAGFKPAPEQRGIYDKVKIKLPPKANNWITMVDGNFPHSMIGPLRGFIRDYSETVVSMDVQIGRVLDALDRLGIADNTAIIYAGDNGYMWGEHRLFDKRWAYEESIRIPFMMRYPGFMKQPGRKAGQMVLNIDVAPTVLDIAGLSPPGDMEGRSVLPLLKEPGMRGREAFLYEYFIDFPYNVPRINAVRTNSHIYIQYAGRKRNELFDIVNDPSQRHNLAGSEKHRGLLRSMRKKLHSLEEGGSYD